MQGTLKQFPLASLTLVAGIDALLLPSQIARHLQKHTPRPWRMGTRRMSNENMITTSTLGGSARPRARTLLLPLRRWEAQDSVHRESSIAAAPAAAAALKTGGGGVRIRGRHPLRRLLHPGFLIPCGIHFNETLYTALNGNMFEPNCRHVRTRLSLRYNLTQESGDVVP